MQYSKSEFKFGFSRKKIPGGRVKVVGIPGGLTKSWGKNMDFQGGRCKKKIDFFNRREGYNFFSGKTRYKLVKDTFIFLLCVGCFWFELSGFLFIWTFCLLITTDFLNLGHFLAFLSMSWFLKKKKHEIIKGGFKIKVFEIIFYYIFEAV